MRMGRGEYQAEVTSSNIGLTSHDQHASHPAIQWDDDGFGEAKKPGLCCLQGCMAGTAVGFSFFVALPTGIILIVLSSNKNDQGLLTIGCALVALPVIVLLVVIVLCINQKKLWCQTRKRKRKTAHAETKVAIHTTASSGQSPV
ncbi:hypothetical protein PoB_001546000 [Plakobranchus ocellatus]|uniref:Uncharacterized protein n=1 Tax=Plakobranchus ocellatus TaxID=259542 RepID=A0AAV3Z0N1_9GAST|nr:hypothetical protein PoB_001546000 [Plakobranchus ocellatus]